MSEKNKDQNKIPTSKVQRASRFLSTGAKVGGNYIKHYSKRVFNPKLDKSELNTANAKDIIKSLSYLKGSALKVAQMMSMDKQGLPQEYQEVFALAQHSAPPLSYPLVVKTFRQYFGEGPDKLFDNFTRQAVHAASIGQVHQAEKDGKKLAVKVQYPGVADSVESDLRMVRPLATRLFSIPETDVDNYMEEVEARLKEETDYVHELQVSQEISAACAHLPGITFANYYGDYSAERVLTMDWLEGETLGQFIKRDTPQELRDRIGQTLWDFYHYQMHHMKLVHADPHPGNYLIQEDGTVAVIDFGCVKRVPDDFYQLYFRFLSGDVFDKPKETEQLLYDLEFLFEDDTPEVKKYFYTVYNDLAAMLRRPFEEGQFDFGNDQYFKELFEYGQSIRNSKYVWQSRRARGSKHGLYVNRTYFGLYNILNGLQANIKAEMPDWLEEQQKVS